MGDSGLVSPTNLLQLLLKEAQSIIQNITSAIVMISCLIEKHKVKDVMA